MKTTAAKVGGWSAILSALFAILWFVTFQLKDIFGAVPPWNDLGAYAQAFRMARLLYVYPSLLLALTCIGLMASIHLLAPESRKIWSLIALSGGIVYAVMAGINYTIQAVAVRQSLLAGETAGIEMWIPDNPHSVFNALANSYVYMAGSMFFAAFVFRGGRLRGWIRGLFLAQGLTATGQIAWSMFGLSTRVIIASSMIWVIGSPAAFILVAILFSREGRIAMVDEPRVKRSPA